MVPSICGIFRQYRFRPGATVHQPQIEKLGKIWTVLKMKPAESRVTMRYALTENTTRSWETYTISSSPRNTLSSKISHYRRLSKLLTIRPGHKDSSLRSSYMTLCPGFRSIQSRCRNKRSEWEQWLAPENRWLNYRPELVSKPLSQNRYHQRPIATWIFATRRLCTRSVQSKNWLDLMSSWIASRKT